MELKLRGSQDGNMALANSNDLVSLFTNYRPSVQLLVLWTGILPICR